MSNDIKVTANRKARLLSHRGLEAGMVLTGTEVSHALAELTYGPWRQRLLKSELFLIYIYLYPWYMFNHDPKRTGRKLMHKRRSRLGQTQEKAKF